MEAGRELDAVIAEKIFGYQHVGEYQKVRVENKSGIQWNLWYQSWMDSQSWGVKIVNHYEETDFMYWGAGKAESLPEFSTEIAAAWQIVEKLRDSGYLVRVQEMPDGIPWLANAIDEPDRPIKKRCSVQLDYFRGRQSSDPAENRRYIREHPWACADTAPLAICLAALRAVED